MTKPRVLLAHSLLWPNVGRLSIAFRKAGFAVDALAPASHPIHKMHSPDRTYVYRPTSPAASLRRAIEISQPQLIIPCDDRIVGHLHRLHGSLSSIQNSAGPQAIATLIETSLGSPASYGLLASRRLIGSLSHLPDVHIPQTDPIGNLRQLRQWIDKYGLPAVLKLDGSWGGRDVIMIRDRAAAAPAYLKMQLHRSLFRRIKAALSSRDIEPMLTYFRTRTPGVSVQSFVSGRLANCAVACWKGEILTSISVEVVRGQAAFGMASVVRPVEGRAMVAAAQSIVRALQLSGLCGFDFVLDDDTGQSKLIEINPRATQINHLSHGASADLPSALRCALSGERVAERAERKPNDEIALFPQEWRRNPQSPFLRGSAHDLPHEEPELMRFYGYEASGTALQDRETINEVDKDVAPGDPVSTRRPADFLAETAVAPCSFDVVQLRQGDAAAPVFLFPGVECDPDELRILADSLKNGRAALALRLNCQLAETDPVVSVNKMARHAIAAIQLIQPSGPYHLVGYSFGGMIAFAAAQQLRAGGEQIGLLALVDTPIRERYWPLATLLRSIVKRTAMQSRALAQLPVKTAAPMFLEKADRLARRFRARFSASFSLSPPTEDDVAQGRRSAAREAMDRYSPGFYPGSLAYLEAGVDRDHYCDFGRLWRSHAASQSTYTFSTDHVGLVTDPEAARLVAERLDACLGDLRLEATLATC